MFSFAAVKSSECGVCDKTVMMLRVTAKEKQCVLDERLSLSAKLLIRPTAMISWCLSVYSFLFFLSCLGENNKAAVDTQLQKWKCPWRKPLIIPAHRPVQTGNQSRHAE